MWAQQKIEGIGSWVATTGIGAYAPRHSMSAGGSDLGRSTAKGSRPAQTAGCTSWICRAFRRAHGRPGGAQAKATLFVAQSLRQSATPQGEGPPAAARRRMGGCPQISPMALAAGGRRSGSQAGNSTQAGRRGRAFSYQSAAGHAVEGERLAGLDAPVLLEGAAALEQVPACMQQSHKPACRGCRTAPASPRLLTHSPAPALAPRGLRPHMRLGLPAFNQYLSCHW